MRFVCRLILSRATFGSVTPRLARAGLAPTRREARKPPFVVQRWCRGQLVTATGIGAKARSASVNVDRPYELEAGREQRVTTTRVRPLVRREPQSAALAGALLAGVSFAPQMLGDRPDLSCDLVVAQRIGALDGCESWRLAPAVGEKKLVCTNLISGTDSPCVHTHTLTPSRSRAVPPRGRGVTTTRLTDSLRNALRSSAGVA